MRVAHLLRKYNPAEWGGTETAVKRLISGLACHDVQSIVYAPHINTPIEYDPFAESGCRVRRFHAFLPVAGLSPDQKQQLIAVGGNLMSFDLLPQLLREPDLSLIHCHTLNRLGGIALAAARLRRCPLVATIHGGVLDLPESVRAQLVAPLKGGIEWGKLFGLLLRSRRVLDRADAIITCNRREAELLEQKFPGKPILVQPHAVPVDIFQADRKSDALAAFPELAGRTVLLAAGRIDPVKNQGWLVQQLPAILERYPAALLVLAGPVTDELYGKAIRKQVRNSGLESRVLFTGGLPPEDPRWVGLFQVADLLLVPSVSETFGLVVLEAWAAKRPVLATKTSGVTELVRHGENGWLFDLNNPGGFLAIIDEALQRHELRSRLGENGFRYVADHHDTEKLAARIRNLYAWLANLK